MHLQGFSNRVSWGKKSVVSLQICDWLKPSMKEVPLHAEVYGA